MTQEQFEREKKYRAALALAKRLLTSGIITPEDFEKAAARFAIIYRPVLAF